MYDEQIEVFVGELDVSASGGALGICFDCFEFSESGGGLNSKKFLGKNRLGEVTKQAFCSHRGRPLFFKLNGITSERFEMLHT